VAELKAAQRKLAQYRQSLLKAAVEGALTADWRAAHHKSQSPPHPSSRRRPGSSALRSDATVAKSKSLDSRLRGNDEQKQEVRECETGADLLQRILTERRARWETKQLAKFADQGKTPPKDWQSKYPEPAAPSVTDLPELPETWVWASLDMLCEIQGGIQKQPSRAPIANKFPFLRVANVARGALKLDDIHEIELFGDELERLALLKGDVLIVEGNGSLSEIGRCALWDGSIENAVHQNHLIRARPVIASSQFVEAWLNSLRGIEKMTNLAATTSGLYTLSVGKISKVPVPLPPLAEQSEVVSILATALDEQARQVIATELGIRKCPAQRRNILKAAFAGQLVPQDPNDEPASVLLERIRAERVSGVAKRSGKHGRKPKEQA
jgi:type I restriction enzyme S subunit